MKPFDLKKFKAGEPACTASGLEAIYISLNDLRVPYPLTVLINEKEELYTEHGLYSRYENIPELELRMK